LPIILCAVFTSQLVHELGHAIAAAIENVPIQSVGASLTLVVPSASVAFMAGALDNKSPRTRSVIVSAGPFHNLVFWALLLLLMKTNLDRFFWQFAYQDVAHLGRIVIHVKQDSILSGYLQPGTLITHIDDTPLASADISNYGWTLPPHDKEPEGWCVERTSLLESQNCCHRVMSDFSPLTCFHAIDAISPLYGCLDPLPILATTNSTRCSVTSPCSASHVCSWPDEREQLLRLAIGDPAEKQDIILWSGPSDEIERTVTLGTLQPRFYFPLTLPLLFTKFSRYISLATLSLYFFNLLPIRLLDGHHLLDIFLRGLSDAGHRSDEYDMEAVTTTTYRRLIWTSRATRLLSIWVPHTMLGILVLASFLMLLNLQ